MLYINYINTVTVTLCYLHVCGCHCEGQGPYGMNEIKMKVLLHQKNTNTRYIE